MTSAFGTQEVPMMTSADCVGEGWHPIIRDLEKHLNQIDPDFTLHQVKEKFGGLRYYASCSVNVSIEQMGEFHDAIHDAEERSFNTCEVCGTQEGVTTKGSWLKTLCPEHRKEVQA